MRTEIHTPQSLGEIYAAAVKIVETAEYHKSAYFWTPPGSAAQRRNKEFDIEFVFSVDGDEYEVSQRLDCSCRNVYYRQSIYKNGSKTTLTVMRSLIKKLEAMPSHRFRHENSKTTVISPKKKSAIKNEIAEVLERAMSRVSNPEGAEHPPLYDYAVHFTLNNTPYSFYQRAYRTKRGAFRYTHDFYNNDQPITLAGVKALARKLGMAQTESAEVA